MDRPIKLSEILSIFIPFVISLITLGFVFGSRISTIESKTTTNTADIKQLQIDRKEDKQEFTKKLDDMSSTLIDIRLLLQEKQDRKK